MKKMLSIMLSVIMAMSILIVPASVSAKQTKKKPNTYVATWGTSTETKVEGLYIPSKRGTIYTLENNYQNLFFKTNKKTITLDKCQRDDEGNDRDIKKYYVRGDKVYYLFQKERKKDYLYQVKTVDLNGKNKKTLFSVSSTDNFFNILGGYGSGVIFHEHKYDKKKGKKLNTVKMFRYKKIKTLFKFYSDDMGTMNIFGGKIFYNNKAYDLEKGKTTSFATKENHVTKNYMYYINKNNNLKSLDKNGVRRIVAKKVNKYYGANDSSTVVYSKLNSNKEEVFYQRTGTKKEYKLFTKKDIDNLILKSNDKESCSVYSSLIHNGKVYFDTSVWTQSVVKASYIIVVDVNGGKSKIYFKTPEEEQYVNMWVFNNKLKCTEVDRYGDTDIDD